MTKIVLMRHGQSEWNLENRFTGWQDVPLSSLGKTEALDAGQKITRANFQFDRAFTSYLVRAIETLHLVLKESKQAWIPVEKSWRLNERNYGALEGLNKKETAEKYGEEQVQIWRRSYDTPPPPLTEQDPRHPQQDRRYQSLIKEDIPFGESLRKCKERVLPFWNTTLFPFLKQGESILIVAHGNSIRSLLQHLENLNEKEIMSLEIPTGQPLVVCFDKQFNFSNKYYL